MSIPIDTSDTETVAKTKRNCILDQELLLEMYGVTLFFSTLQDESGGRLQNLTSSACFRLGLSKPATI